MSASLLRLLVMLALYGGAFTRIIPESVKKQTKEESLGVQSETHTLELYPEQSVRSSVNVGAETENKKQRQTTILLHSGTTLLRIERTPDDVIRTCTIITGNNDDVAGNDDVTGELIVVPVSEELMTELMYTCRQIDGNSKAGRQKRLDIVMPGTKWCGLGNSAEDYDDLGENEAVDICCRAHDNCEPSLPFLAYDPDLDLRNWNIYTKSGCDCEQPLYDCLKAANDTLIGRAYFNILDPVCIGWGPKCLRRNWYWGCVEWDEGWVFLDNDLVY